MKASAILLGLAGVRACVVGDDEGHVIERSGVEVEGAGPIIAAVAKLTTSLGAVGALLGLGGVEVATTRGAKAAWVVASDAGASIAVRVEGGSPTTAVEAVLKNTDWFALIEWDVRDADLEWVPAAPGRSEGDDRQTRPVPGLDSPRERGATASRPAALEGASAGAPASPQRERGADSAVKWRAASNLSTALRAARASVDGAKAVEREARGRTPALPVEFEAEVTKSAARLLPCAPAFVGRLETLCLPDLLEFLRNGQRTGVMLFSSSAGTGKIHVRAGRLTGASAPTTTSLPGLLVAGGAVTAEALHALRHVGPEAWSKPEIGATLVAAGAVTIAQVRKALGEQIRSAVSELLSWNDGDFSFESEAPVGALSALDEELEFDSHEIMLELLKSQDEAARVSK
jgi:hypothetical protein